MHEGGGWVTLTCGSLYAFQSQLKMDKDIPKEIRAERVDDVMQEVIDEHSWTLFFSFYFLCLSAAHVTCHMDS